MGVPLSGPFDDLGTREAIGDVPAGTRGLTSEASYRSAEAVSDAGTRRRSGPSAPSRCRAWIRRRRTNRGDARSSALRPKRRYASTSSSDAIADRPSGEEARKALRRLGEVHPVASRVGPAPLRVGDATAWKHLRDDVGDVTNLVVLRRPSDVECLAVDRVPRCQQGSQHRAGYVFDMDQRPPRRPVAPDEHFAGHQRARDEVVDDQVQAKVGRVPVDGRVPKEDRAEVVVGEFRDGTFREDLRLAVRRHRVEGGGFGEQIVGRRRSVQAARRREDEAFDPSLLGQTSDPDRAEMVDLERARGIQVPDRVVRDRREVHHGVERPADDRPRRP